VSLRVVSWNLFHGRDFPPNPGLFTLRSRLLGTAERNATHLQVNRDLEPEFAETLASALWDVALLQECPPRWADSLAAACAAKGHLSPTSRNWLGALRAPVARLNPDLMGSWEGGSNLTLVRGRRVERRGEVVLRRRPERRTLVLTLLSADSPPERVAVGNLHASTRAALAEEELVAAAEAAVDFARGAPLVLGGDLNLRPEETTVFSTLAERFALRGAGPAGSIDHVLVRGLDIAEPTRAWPPEARERSEDGLAIRLSDHAPVEALLDAPQAAE
jgi:endonuclease/exonuclease/phosphatase family metal-dependent hydrolase